MEHMENTIDLRANLGATIPAERVLPAYRILWGAGDFWVLPDRIFELYDVFVSGGLLVSANYQPPAHNLIRDADPGNTLLRNRESAVRLQKLIVYMDINDPDQRVAFAELFKNSVSLFEELGVHNNLEIYMHLSMLRKIMKVDGQLNLSTLDSLCDGSIRTAGLNTIHDIQMNDFCIRLLGRVNVLNEAYIEKLAAYRRQLGESIRPPYILHRNVGELSFNDLVFIVGLQNYLSTLHIPGFNFVFNRTPREYSNEPILRVTLVKTLNLEGNIRAATEMRARIRQQRNNAWTRRTHLAAFFSPAATSRRNRKTLRRRKRR